MTVEVEAIRREEREELEELLKLRFMSKRARLFYLLEKQHKEQQRLGIKPDLSRLAEILSEARKKVTLEDVVERRKRDPGNSLPPMPKASYR